mmetsp:Transcript_12439/g.39828  ORF Transcript_12439/g.39828 Transcript_12439/m.39828 type:complete len:380 (+) Transcript_12439:991-2130(+)
MLELGRLAVRPRLAPAIPGGPDCGTRMWGHSADRAPRQGAGDASDLGSSLQVRRLVPSSFHRFEQLPRAARRGAADVGGDVGVEQALPTIRHRWHRVARRCRAVGADGTRALRGLGRLFEASLSAGVRRGRAMCAGLARLAKTSVADWPSDACCRGGNAEDRVDVLGPGRGQARPVSASMRALLEGAESNLAGCRSRHQHMLPVYRPRRPARHVGAAAPRCHLGRCASGAASETRRRVRRRWGHLPRAFRRMVASQAREQGIYGVLLRNLWPQRPQKRPRRVCRELVPGMPSRKPTHGRLARRLRAILGRAGERLRRRGPRGERDVPGRGPGLHDGGPAELLDHAQLLQVAAGPRRGRAALVAGGCAVDVRRRRHRLDT